MEFPDLGALDAPQQPIEFYFEDVDVELPDETQLRDWLSAAAAAEGKTVAELGYIFCSDEHLRGINVEFLDHDYYTDIITFDSSEGLALSGEMYISTDRVAENALDNRVPFAHELCRVMVHGLLHLAGYGDKTPGEEQIMRSREDFYLARLPFGF